MRHWLQRKFRVLSSTLFVLLALPAASLPAERADPVPCVILLHGITKDGDSMLSFERALSEQGYHVVNLHYPSRQQSIQQLAAEALPRGLAACEAAAAAPINFVAHSMGSLLVRQFYASHSAAGVHRAVMLGPPNQGSRLGNVLSCIPWIKDLNGPAGKQMGIDRHSIPSQLGPIPFTTGVIAGTRSFNFLFSAIIEGDDDGRVGLPSTYVRGVCARTALPVTHGGLTSDTRAISETLSYLRSGRFEAADAEYFPCGDVVGK